MGGPGSSTLLAKIEPSGFFVSLASHIFIFLNKHMLTSEATIISNYIKNGLAEPQMIVLADMIHDLEGMISFSNLFLTKFYFSWKKYFPNLLERWLFHQNYVFWVRDLKFWQLAYFFHFAELCKVSARLDNIDIRHFIRVPPLNFW